MALDTSQEYTDYLKKLYNKVISTTPKNSSHIIQISHKGQSQTFTNQINFFQTKGKTKIKYKKGIFKKPQIFPKNNMYLPLPAISTRTLPQNFYYHIFLCFFCI